MVGFPVTTGFLTEQISDCDYENVWHWCWKILSVFIGFKKEDDEEQEPY